MKPTDKQFLTSLAVPVSGDSTDQLITFAGGPAEDAGARKAAAMHAANATNIDKQVVRAELRAEANAERKGRLASFKDKRMARKSA